MKPGLWRWLFGDASPDAGGAATAAEIERLLSTLRAAKHGDLAARTGPSMGSLSEVGRELDETLDALAASFGRLAAAARSCATAAAAAAQPNRLLAERAGQQRTAAGDIARKLRSLGARAGEVEQIVEVLDDVASETHTLALNAALEAARAGAQGKGFGMVADEVLKLADRSGSATKDIGAFIQSLQGTTHDATASVEAIRGESEALLAHAAQASTATSALAGSAHALVRELEAWRLPGDDQALAGALRSRQGEIAAALAGLAPLIEGGSGPIADSLRRILAALKEDGTSRPPASIAAEADGKTAAGN